MKKEEIALYRCPRTGDELTLDPKTELNDKEINSGTLVSSDGTGYNIKNGIPDFTYPKELKGNDSISRDSYNSISDDYNVLQKVTFKILRQDEKEFRSNMVRLLKLKPKYTILETAAGTGLNFPYLIQEMNGEGTIFAQDISPGMLQHARDMYCDHKKSGMGFSWSLGNAAYLPFPDKFFDAVLSFGGIGVFNDKKRAIQEMCRVTKTGGQIVFGDEGVAPWLRDTEYGKILIDNNRFYLNQAPIDLIPVEAREVCVRWVMGGSFYIINFISGTGEPKANIDYEIPGSRGGTLRSRYYGKLEGVSPETKKIAIKAIKKAEMSAHEWLDKAILNAANDALKE